MIHIYTGEGKGKTTAALGLALRAAGAGLKVYIGQFIKGKNYSELKTLKKIKNIKVEQFGRSCFIRCKPNKKDIEVAKNGLQRIREILVRKNFDVIILDEINVAVKLNLLRLKEVVRLIEKIPKKTEIILTGRWAHPKILKLAHLITEMKDIKHYYKKGVKARKGIEY
ncbi:MAG: cob(I)yrinic acid a,c-diamide adenosyltransferase [Candidatus Omnitrophota bacterium]|nr:cob(I)yrinic acid a,c-diamide adenosyltransferase [Candidatus Omnitrophota bacterium]